MKIIRSKGLFAMIGEEEKPFVFTDNSEEYRKCLEEIREIVKKYDAEVGDTIIANPIQDCYDIFAKINEVLGNE